MSLPSVAPVSETRTPPIDLDLRIETPENVVLTFRLAGPGLRCAAFLVDYVVRAAIYVAGLIIAGIGAIALGGIALGMWLLLAFVVEWCYFIVCEACFNGKSIGKHIFGLRVIQENGHPLSLWSSALRNLARVVDLLPFVLVLQNEFAVLTFLPLYGPGLAAMLLGSKLQRIGDLVAGTVVVHERRVRLPREPLIVERIQPLPRDEIGGFVPSVETLALIDRFLGRRSVLTHARGHALARVLARALAERLDYAGDPALPSRYPMAFLARIYVTFATLREQQEQEEESLHSPTTRGAAARLAGAAG